MKNILYGSIFMLIYCCNGQNIHKEYYPNGGIKMEVLIKNNLPNGYFIEYFESGNLKTKGNLINGKREGLFYEYNTNSTIFSLILGLYPYRPKSCMSSEKSEKAYI